MGVGAGWCLVASSADTARETLVAGVEPNMGRTD